MEMYFKKLSRNPSTSSTASTSAEGSNIENKDQPASKKIKMSEEKGEDFQANEPK